MEWFNNFYWNLPGWCRWAVVLGITLELFKSYLRSLYSKKDFTAASFYMMLFILFMYSILNYFGSEFNLISGG